MADPIWNGDDDLRAEAEAESAKYRNGHAKPNGHADGPAHNGSTSGTANPHRRSAMTTWLELLEAELARRRARQEWAAGEDGRQRQSILDTLQQMAQRFAAAGPLHQLQLADMSPAEKLCCHLLPKELRPAGLPSEAVIWAEYEAKR